MIEFKKSSDVSGYIKIGDWQIYVEASEATEQRPYVSVFQDTWPEDTTLTWTVKEKDLPK
jgi:hypothetical protein